MKRRLALAAVGCAVAVSTAAQTVTWSRMTFAAVDGVRLDGGGFLLVSGVVSGDSASTEYRFTRQSVGLDLADCRRFALLAMSKPGQYVLSFDAAPTSQYTYVRDCKLERARP